MVQSEVYGLFYVPTTCPTTFYFFYCGQAGITTIIFCCVILFRFCPLLNRPHPSFPSPVGEKGGAALQRQTLIYHINIRSLLTTFGEHLFNRLRRKTRAVC